MPSDDALEAMPAHPGPTGHQSCRPSLMSRRARSSAG